MHAQRKTLLKQTSLSRFTVSCRINDPLYNIKESLKKRLKSCEAFSLALDESTDISDTAKLVIFIRAVTADFDIAEEFLDMASLSFTTTGKDICKQVLKVVGNFELNFAKLCGVIAHGAPSMTDRINGFSKNFLNAVGAQNVVVSHWIIHQDNLCTKVLDFAEVVGNVAQWLNYIRARGLNHPQLKPFLDELDTVYSDVVYFSAVHWLSRVATLKKFWNLRQEITFFMESKHRNVTFLSNENCLNDFAFLTDITQHSFELNLNLQEKNQLVNKMFEHICDFEKNLELFQVQLKIATLTHFACLATRKLEFLDLDCSKYGARTEKLRNKFANRFSNFRQNEIKVTLVA